MHGRMLVGLRVNQRNRSEPIIEGGMRVVGMRWIAVARSGRSDLTKIAAAFTAAEHAVRSLFGRGRTQGRLEREDFALIRLVTQGDYGNSSAAPRARRIEEFAVFLCEPVNFRNHRLMASGKNTPIRSFPLPLRLSQDAKTAADPLFSGTGGRRGGGSR